MRYPLPFLFYHRYTDHLSNPQGVDGLRLAIGDNLARSEAPSSFAQAFSKLVRLTHNSQAWFKT